MRILIVLSFCLCLQTSHVTSDIAEPAVLGSVGSNNDFSNRKDFSNNDLSHTDTANKDVFRNDIPSKDIYKNEKPGQIRVSKCCEFDSLLIESNLGVRECRRRADVLHLNVDVSRRKWEPAFFDPESGDEIIGPEKYVLDIGVPNCESHESKFAVFHHQVIILLLIFFCCCCCCCFCCCCCCHCCCC